MKTEIKVLDKGFVTLVDSMPAVCKVTEGWGPGDARVVEAARVSYKSQGKTIEQDKKLLKYLYKNDHSSPFEKVTLEFHVKAPLFIARQWMRHRTASVNEISARYTEVQDEFYLPERSRMQAQSTSNKQASGEALHAIEADKCQDDMEEAWRFAYERYKHMLSMGLSRELARMVLPVSMYTEFYWTINLRNLMHFLKLRLHNHAQYEIRVYALALQALASEVAPYTLALFWDSVSDYE